MNWETVVVSLILILMLVALIRGGDKLDQWTFNRTETKKKRYYKREDING